MQNINNTTAHCPNGGDSGCLMVIVVIMLLFGVCNDMSVLDTRAQKIERLVEEIHAMNVERK